MIYFNPRTPVGCDTNTAQNTRTPLYFNPRTPVGCDVSKSVFPPNVSRISIHAPQWGATIIPCGFTYYGAISIHAPQWGATKSFEHGSKHGVISIHAPQWGATWGETGGLQIQLNFNPRTPVGCDCHVSPYVCEARVFQSTHPSGVRPREWA